MTTLDQQLFRLRARLRLQRAVATIPRALLLGSIVVCLILIGQALASAALSIPLAVAAGALAATGLAAVGVWRRPSLHETARVADYRLGLHQRLGTAIQLLDEGVNGLLVEFQLQDASRAAQAVKPSAAFPLRFARREVALSALTMAAAAVFVLWATTPVDSGSPLLALYDRGRAQPDSEELLNADSLVPPGDLSSAREPSQSLVPGEQRDGMTVTPINPNGPTPPQQQGQPELSRAERADEQLRVQQDPNVAQRREALQDVASALKQNQTTRAAGESLSREDYQKAAEQLRQAADNLRRLSPGERSRLAQQLRDTARQIQDRDPQLASQLERAASALEQYRDQEAREALRNAAQQIQQTGQQLQAQRDLEQRRETTQRGDAQRAQARPGQQLDGRQQQSPQQGQQGQAGQPPRAREGGRPEAGQGGEAGAQGQEGENGQRGQGRGAGAGVGSGEGQNPEALPHRLNVEGQRTLVEADVGEGPSQWRPASPEALPGFGQPAAAAVPAAPASTSVVTGGADLNLVPSDLARAVQQYFMPQPPASRTPDATPAQPAPGPAESSSGSTRSSSSSSSTGSTGSTGITGSSGGAGSSGTRPSGVRPRTRLGTGSP